MTRTKRVVLVIVAAVLLLAGGLAGLAAYYLAPERLTPLVRNYLAGLTGREVALARVELSPFSGLKLTGLTIQDSPAFGGGRLVGLAGLEADFSPWGLLAGRVAAVRLDKPALGVVRDKGGRFNLEDLRQAIVELEKRLARFHVGALRLKDGQVDLLDLASGQKAKLAQVQVTAGGLSISRPFSLDLSARLNGAALKLTAQPSGQARLSLEPLDLAGLAGFLPAALPLRPLAGRLSAEATAEFETLFKVKGRGQVKAARLALAAAGRTWPAQDLGLEFDLGLDLTAMRLDLAKLDLLLGQNRIQAAGRASLKDLDLSLTLPPQGWDSLAAALGRTDLPQGRLEGRLKLAGADVEGPLELTTQLRLFDLRPKGSPKGSKDKPLEVKLAAAGQVRPAQGQADLASLSLAGPAVAAQGSARLTGQALKLDLAGLEVDLARLSALAPEPLPVSLAGRVKGQVQASLAPADPAKASLQVRLELVEVRVGHPDLPGPVALAGRVELAGQDLTGLALQGSLKGTGFHLSGQGRNVLTQPDLHLDVEADQVNLTDLLGPRLKGAFGLSGGAKPEPVDLNLTLRGRLAVDKLKVWLVPFNKFGLDYELKDNVLNLRPLPKSAWSGTTLSSPLTFSLGRSKPAGTAATKEEKPAKKPAPAPSRKSKRR